MACMNVTNFVICVSLTIGMYVCEYIAFGLWYRLYIKSNVRYHTFFKKMLRYYWYCLCHPFDENQLKEPKSKSFLLYSSLAVPPIISLFVFVIDNWPVDIVFIFAGFSIVVSGLFREERVSTKDRISEWIRFLNSPECISALRGVRKDEVSDEYKERDVPLSKEERRKDLIFLVPALVVAIALVTALIAGCVFEFRNGTFGSQRSLLKIFSSETYNKATYILLCILVVLVLVYQFSDKGFRKDEKKKIVGIFCKQKQRIRNALGLTTDIIVFPTLSEWEESIVSMCNALNICHVAVLSETDMVGLSFSGKIAMAGVDSDGVPFVVLSTKRIDEFRRRFAPELVNGMVCFMIGHELVHVRYRDYKPAWRDAKILAVEVAVLIIGIPVMYKFVCMMGTVSLLGEFFQGFFAVLMLFLIVVFWKLMRESYWNYVSEYRADRKSKYISGATDEAIENMLLLDDNQGVNQKSNRFGKKKDSPRCKLSFEGASAWSEMECF